MAWQCPTSSANDPNMEVYILVGEGVRKGWET